MKNGKLKILTVFVFAAFAGGLFSVQQSLSYSTNNTHPFLTEKIAELHNLKDKKNTISKKEIGWMMKGAIQEDDPPRWINHFYDPVHKIGWTGKHFGDLSEKEGYETGADMAPKPAIASVDWAENQQYQAAYGRQYGNRTWQKAVKSYIDGDKEAAFLALGDILHLIEDLSVPAHTRNDSHPGIDGDPGSPYEDYAKKITNFHEEKIISVNSLVKENKSVPSFQKLSDAFDYIAEYSNKNFFSEDTINNKDFKEPNLEKLEKETKNVNGDKILFLKKGDKYLAYLYSKNKYSTDDEDFVLPSYLSRLISESVLTGAGVVDLFFRDVKKYRKNPELLEPIVPDSNEPILDAAKSAPKIIVIKSKDFLDEIWISTLKKGISAKDTLAGAANGVKSGIGSIIDAIKDSLLKRKPEVVSTGVLATAVGADILSPNSSDTPALPVQNADEASPRADEASPAQSEASPRAGNEGEPEQSGQAVSQESTPVKVAVQSSEESARDADLRALSIQLAAARDALNRTSAAVDAAVTAETAPEPEPVPPTSEAVKPEFAISQPYPGYGGGGGGGGGGVAVPAAKKAAKKADDGEKKKDEKKEPDAVPPESPTILSPSDFSKPFTSSEIVFSGTAEASSTVSAFFEDSGSAAATTTANSSGAWSLPLSFDQGSSTVSFFAVGESERTSSSTEISLFVDSEAPAVSLGIAECLDSPANEPCLSATTTLNISWSSPSSDLSFFTINANGSVSTTTATSTTVIAKDNSTYSFSIFATDFAGNRSATTTATAEVSTMPIVINEVAWEGTGSNATTSKDEWIELYNRTNRGIDLSGWTLYSETDMKPYIVFGQDSKNKITKNAVIPAKGYYLIERTDASTTSETEDWYGSFGKGLSNAGEVLVLSYASTTVDRTPDRAKMGWTSGDNYYTMERRDPNLSGIERENWGTNNGIMTNGKNVEGNAIQGTPKARNSVNYLIGAGRPVISPPSEITLTKENNPYIIISRKFFASTTSLTIEPGVIIKFIDGAGFNFTGGSKIIADGTEDDPIVFTSFADDEYGGDTNGDATTTSPSRGVWLGVRVETDNNDSVFNHTIFRFGGGSDWSFGRADLLWQ